MAKYLLTGSYTVAGAKGVVKEGGVKRRAAVEQAVKSVGGSVDVFYWAFGGEDVVAIFDLPDNVSAAALSMSVASAGGFAPKTTVLITPEEMDRATKKAVKYRPPGA